MHATIDTSPATPGLRAPPGADAEGSTPRHALLASLAGLAVVLAAVAVTYRRALDADFQFDDLLGVLGNAQLEDLVRFVRVAFIPEILRGGRAVADLSFAVDHALAGWDAQQFHATSVSVHLATVIAIYALTRAILWHAGVRVDAIWALAVTAIWGIHPLHTEAVTYVSQRAEVLAALFTAVSFLLLLASERRGAAASGTLTYVAAFGAFVLGVGAKANAAVVPLLYLLHAACFPRPGPRAWRAVALRAAPFVAVLLAGAVILLSSFAHHTDVGFDIPGVTVRGYALTQLRVVLRYVGLLFWPARQNVDWDVKLSAGLDASTGAAAVVLVALSAGAVWLLVRARHLPPERAGTSRLIAFGFGWFLVNLAPTSSVVPLADFLVEHRVYLASWGIVLAAVVALHSGVQLLGTRLAVALAVAVAGAVVALGVATNARNAAWRTRETLWADAAAKSPAKARPHTNLGEALWRRGAAEEALAQFRTALALGGSSMLAVDRARLYQNMSAALGHLGRYDESIAAALAGLALAPDVPVLLTNLVESYRATGNIEGARRYSAEIVRLQPRSMAAHNAYGQLLMAGGDAAAALAEFATAAALDPAAFEPAVNTALAYEKLADRARACVAWRRVSERAPRPQLRDAAARHRREIGCTDP